MSVTTTPLLDPTTAGLEPFADAGVVDAAGAHVAAAVGRSTGDERLEVLLAAALAVRAVQLGHVCVELSRAATTITTDVPTEVAADGDTDTAKVPWPDPAEWLEMVRSSDAVTVVDGNPLDPLADDPDGEPLRPLVLWGDRLYLERYWRYERAVGDDLVARSTTEADDLDHSDVEGALDRAFGPVDATSPDRQRQAAEVALTHRLTVVAGGPGTGKTHTVARLLAAAHDLARAEGRTLDVALAAPTGKAAARMTEAVHQAVERAELDADVADALLAVEARTIHRLLGAQGALRFRHDRTNPLPYDVVVIDETSMVALPLMARLLDAVRPDARVVLVGDPYQLASVEAGAVLGDLVGPTATPGDRATTGVLEPVIVVLERVHRFAAGSGIAELADAVRAGDAERALEILRDPARPDAVLADPSDDDARRPVERLVVANATAVVEAARAGDEAAGLKRCGDLKVLCATRHGPNGRRAWSDLVERRLQRAVPDVGIRRRWYTGRPVIVTRNDPLAGVANGDTGLVVERDGSPMVAFPAAGTPRLVSPATLDAIDTWWAMTIHKSQGSEFTHAVVALPTTHSPILTRELLYTGVTRAQQQVTVVATEESLRRAIERPVARASGLGARLWPS